MAPIPDKDCVHLVNLPDENATAALARRLAPLLRGGDMVALRGEIGAGKTAFARALIRTLGEPEEEVPSPTFTLVQTYDAEPANLWHFDLYRLSGPDEAVELGWEEARSTGISLVEWPDRLGPMLPEDRLDITFAYASQGRSRTARLQGFGAWRDRIAALR